MYKYYDVQGQTIEKENFIWLYNNIYLYKNDCMREKEIEKIYENEELSLEDVIKFLRWKVGNKGEGNLIKTRSGEINIEDLKGLVSGMDSLRQKSDVDLYRDIVDRKIKNIGGVYTLALVSVITNGREPIYDRYAETALRVIVNNKHGFREPYNYEELPGKYDVPGVMERYDKYKDLLTEVFGSKWQETRDIDRALWTYGHLFYSK